MLLGAEIIEQSAAEVCANTDQHWHRRFQTSFSPQTSDCSIISTLGETAGYYKIPIHELVFHELVFCGVLLSLPGACEVEPSMQSKLIQF